MTEQTVQILSRFKGPPDSGNGGYTAGLLAKHIDGDVKVMLRQPPPLDRPLRIEKSTSQACLYDGEQLVATAEHSELDLSVPRCPDESTITAATPSFHVPDDHVQPACFVCGPERAVGDGLRIFATPIDGEAACVAGLWLPDPSLDDGSGLVATEFIWAALDCPGYFAHRTDNLKMLLGTITGSVTKQPAIGQRMISMGWQLEVSGRKYFSATALVDNDGEVYAKSQQTWISLTH